jgi:hypothetical protein
MSFGNGVLMRRPMEAEDPRGMLLDKRDLSERASFFMASRRSFDVSGKIRVARSSSSSDFDATARAVVHVESGEMDTLAVGACFRTSVAICLRRCAVDISNL